MTSETPERVLVVEDDDPLRRLLLEVLDLHGYAAVGSPNVVHAIGVLHGGGVDLVVTDLALPGIRGEQLLAQVRARFQIPVIAITAFGSVESAVALTRAGATDYLTKPFGAEVFLDTVKRVLDETRPERRQARERRSESGSHLSGIVGRSGPMRRLFEQIERVASSSASVLITGETGTGKELVAGAIHRASRRDPFVPINAAAIPAELLESELFGHAKGAFTGAAQAKPGLFEVAHGGTLFLDEIGEMPPLLQAKLLRVLQSGELRRVGEVESRSVDVRVIAATHHDLRGAMVARRFREDLFFRLNVVPIEVPPLRERPTDIPLLAERFLTQICQREGWPEKRLSAAALAALVGYSWPGNVRELLNVVERSAVFAEHGEIRPDDLPGEVYRRPALPEPVQQAAERQLSLAELEREYVLELLRRNGGNKKRVAELLQVPRRTLYRMLASYTRSPAP